MSVQVQRNADIGMTFSSHRRYRKVKSPDQECSAPFSMALFLTGLFIFCGK